MPAHKLKRRLSVEPILYFESPKEPGVLVIPTGIHIDPAQSDDSLIKVNHPTACCGVFSVNFYKNIADTITALHDGEFVGGTESPRLLD